jgi:hypothetical protein
MSSATTPGARALASRRNGAKSRGPASAAGRARSARNALKHGLRATKLVLLEDEDEDEDEFHAFAAALQAELGPRGVLQEDLVARPTLAAWRARRADRIEAELFAYYLDAGGGGDERCRSPGFGIVLVRDGNGPRALDTLLRYRDSAHAELFRALGALKALQAEQRERAGPGAAELLLPPSAKRTRDWPGS